MKRNVKFSAPVLASIAAMFVAPVLAQQTPTPYSVHMTGYEETALTLNTTGSGDFKAIVSADGTSIQYMLMYRDLSSPATQAHIHFGRPAITGGIVLWLCANTPLPPRRPLSRYLSHVPLPADHHPHADRRRCRWVSGQGIDAGTAGFAQMVAALRTGSAYANVHTTLRPGGEVRGRIGPAPLGAPSTNTSND
jgi:hypothetical protein